ncbi:MAG: MBL fold metallo-hydrolase [Deltaproteobacteria bacterium]|nr:MBL fold metallo-hydrolase [Deltaproteobacteria bacterium]
MRSRLVASLRPVPVLLGAIALLTACMPTIPQRSLPPQPPPAPPDLPALAPCALVHQTSEEDLSNGARGWFRGTWMSQYSTFLIRHPKGVYLIDASMGSDTAGDLDKSPFWFRLQFGDAKSAKPLKVLLAEAGVKPEEVTAVLLTHTHWDHTGGLAELPNARVIMSAADADWILKQQDFLIEGNMPRHFDTVKDRIDRLKFDGPPTDGFPASQDVLGDGSIIAIPTPGHTRGSTSYFVRSSDGHRWLFIGDAAWVKEGFEEPATKGRLASTVVDQDKQQTADTLALLHEVYAAKNATLVTAHDARTWQDVPLCKAPATVVK